MSSGRRKVVATARIHAYQWTSSNDCIARSDDLVVDEIGTYCHKRRRESLDHWPNRARRSTRIVRSVERSNDSSSSWRKGKASKAEGATAKAHNKPEAQITCGTLRFISHPERPPRDAFSMSIGFIVKKVTIMSEMKTTSTLYPP